MAKLPENIGKYRIESLIAKGGMGSVYKAIHPTLNRPVIIKKLTLRGRKDIAERFKREARILMDFRHEGVVNMYDHFKIGSSYYIVLEYVDGAALDSIIKKQRYLDNGVAGYILYHAAQSLFYAHEKKVIHRDIKPANLLLSKTGEVKLVDFGIAVSDGDSEEGLTREGMTLGTPGYMAPEQFSNTKNVDLRADIYSLGVLVYEMLTGKKPFPGGFSPELVLKIQKGKYPNPRKFNPHIHPVLLRFIKKSMKAGSDRRYQNLLPVIRDLEHFLKGYNPVELSNIVANLAEGNEGWKPKYKRKGRIILKVIIPVISGIILLIPGLFCYFTGYQNGIFRSKNYSPVVFDVTAAGIT
ncbi:MAG: serine/threonine protein kinase, partial [Spirochaetaceae bacterium]|nr:serine/threonine protein kinase [Spirochaetaceae bacterium]